jgi:hypothetical protein
MVRWPVFSRAPAAALVSLLVWAFPRWPSTAFRRAMRDIPPLSRLASDVNL